MKPDLIYHDLVDLLDRFDDKVKNMLIWPSGHKSVQKEGKAPIIELMDYVKKVKPS